MPFSCRNSSKILATIILSLGWLTPAVAQDSEAALEAVRGRIEALESRLAGQLRVRDRRSAELREIELEIAETNEELGRLASAIGDKREELDRLAEESAATLERLGLEKIALGNQVRMSYMTGRAEALKLLLSQENPAALGRMSVYYDYLNRARSRRIEAVEADLNALEAIAENARRASVDLENLEAERRGELRSLEGRRTERGRLLAEVENAIDEADDEVGRLRAEEERLKSLLIELSDVMAGFPVDPDQSFADLKGRLSWPVSGRLTADFGEARDGGPLPWNGVLLEAPAGMEVRAVHYGRVAFADWLPGLGLLVIIDHGDGYMSLYGHNELLLRTPGDWVAAGAPIAQVGDTGGRARTSLYFEIRHNGEPVNPRAWMSGPPMP